MIYQNEYKLHIYLYLSGNLKHLICNLFYFLSNGMNLIFSFNFIQNDDKIPFCRYLQWCKNHGFLSNEYTTIYSVGQNKILPEKHGLLTGLEKNLVFYKLFIISRCDLSYKAFFNFLAEKEKIIF